MQDNSEHRYRLLSFLVDPRWLEAIAQAWKLGRKILRGFANEGIYEVLDFERQIELKDIRGKRATIKKREKVRYLQDNISTYQDWAWGDKKVFTNYRCSPGTPVDEFRLGHKTCKLISLRELRRKGDIDEFWIEWEMIKGFLKSTAFWGTGIRHRTKKVTVKVIFPKGRPPLHATVTESNLQRTQTLGTETQKKLPDGRTMIIWEKENPRLYENYVLKWEW
jgi:hypothetical protein